MNKLINTIKREAFLGLLIITLILTNSVHVYAASGSIDVNLVDHSQMGAGVAGVEFSIYQVGTVQDDLHSLVFDPVYGINAYPQNAEETEAVIKILQAKVSGEPIQRRTTDANGALEFGDLADGIYFVMANPGNSYGEIMPFIIQLPYYEVVNGEMIGPAYEIAVEPKAQPTPSESESETDQTGESGEETNGPGAETNPPGEGPGGSGNPNGSNGSAGSGSTVPGSSDEYCPTVTIKNSGAEKTSDTSMIGLYLCVAASSLLVILGVIVKARGKREKA